MNQNNQTLLIWDFADSPPPDYHSIVLWRSYGEQSCPNAVSIPALIEENADALRSRYLAWVYEMGETRIRGKRLVDHLELRPGFSCWWMTLIVEKSNFAKSPHITDAIRLFAFEDWSEGKTIDQIKLVSANQPLAKCLKNWCKIREIPFEWQQLPPSNEPVSWLRRIYRLLPYTLQALIWLLKYVVEGWPLRGEGLDEWRQTEGKVTFVSYLLNLVPEAVREGRFDSLYWTKLPAQLQADGIKTNWLHLYVQDRTIPTARQAAKAIRRFNCSVNGNQTHVTLSSFLNLRVVYKTLRDWFRIRHVHNEIESVLDNKQQALILWPLFKEDWRSSVSGPVAMSNHMMFNLFEAAFNNLPAQEKGVYLQENEGWEFGMIQAWRQSDHKKLIGFPHTTVRYWDLRYFFEPRSYTAKGTNQIPLPDRVACNGTVTLESYRSGGYPEEWVTDVESLRYLHLSDDSNKSESKVQHTRKRLLVVGDYVAINMHKQMQLLEQATQLFQEGTKITLKPHPACPVEIAKSPQLIMTIETRPIEELLAESDLVYSSTMTSAAVDAYCAGLPVITFLDGSVLNLSPLRKCKGVTFVSKPEELAEAINHVKQTDGKNSMRQEYFNLDTSLSAWQSLLCTR